MSTPDALWRRLVTITAGRAGARLCWPSALLRDKVAFHEAGHILAASWEGVAVQGSALVEGGGIVSWTAGLEAASLTPRDLPNDARVARRIVERLLTAAGVDSSWRAGLFLVRAAVREVEVGLRFEYLAFVRLAIELSRRGSLTRGEIEAIRHASGARRGLTPGERLKAGLPELPELLAEARRRWPSGVMMVRSPGIIGGY